MNREYVSMFYEDWIILLAKHGFLRPTDVVQKKYDVTFRSLNPEIVSIQELKKQVREKGLFQYDELVVRGGRD